MNDNSKLAKPLRKLTSLVRPKYSPGLLLQDDDLTAGVSYTRNLSRLLFRTIFGCGVLCGLIVDKPKLKCGKLTVDVGKGVALSCAGDPIEVPATQEITLDPCGEEVPDTLWIAVKHIDTCCVPRAAQCPPDEDEPPTACTREYDGFELRVFTERPGCSCGCSVLAQSQQAQSSQAADAAARKPKAKSGTLNPLTASKPADSAAPAQTLGTVAAGAAETEEPAVPATNDPCLCNLRTGKGTENSKEGCYFPYYDGQCPCDCCDCDWIILAVAKHDDQRDTWSVDHSVRRFVRPVLMRDPQIEKDRAATSTS
jgi:hypothetical protein